VAQAEFNDATGYSVNVNYAFSWSFNPWQPSGTNASLNWVGSTLIPGDFDSLVIDNQIELMGGPGGVQCNNQLFLDAFGQGPTFRLFAPSSTNSAGFGYSVSYDLNAPQPTQDVVESMLLDGERPFGSRASNRTLTLPVFIQASPAGSVQQVQAAMEWLMSIVDQQTFEIKWTPADTGLSMLFDCFRALPTDITYGFNYNAGNGNDPSQGRTNAKMASLQLQIQALPYARSDVDGIQTLSFTNPLVGKIPSQTPNILDEFLPSTYQINPVFLGSQSATVGSTSTTMTVTDHSLWWSGIAVAVAVGNSTSDTVTVNDSQGNTYKQISSTLSASPGVVRQTIFAAVNAVPLTANVDTITVTSSAAGTWSVMAASVPGINQTDQNGPATNAGNSASPTITSSIPVNGTGSILAFFADNNSSATTVASGWSNVGGITTTTGAVRQDMFVANMQGTVALTANGSLSSSTPWVSSTLSFNATPGRRWGWDNYTALPVSTGNSIHYQAPRPIRSPYPPAVYAAPFYTASSGYTTKGPVSMVGLPSLSFNFGQAYDTQWPKSANYVSNVTFNWTLYDSSGRTLNFSKTINKCKWGSSPSAPKWTQVNIPIPQGNKSFSYNTVTSYKVSVTNWSGSGGSGYVRMHCWLSLLTANPQTIATASSPRGMVYNCFGLPGTARSPISVHCQLPASAPQVQEITKSGTWTVPAGVYQLAVEAWGGGGAGASVSGNQNGAGGGGAEYAAEPTLNVKPGTKIPVTVGNGGLAAQLTPTVVQFKNNGLSHWTCPANVSQAKVEVWGGGAAGGAGAGGGGGGEYAAHNTYSVTPGTTYNCSVGAGGKPNSGKSTAQNASRGGGMSYFGPPGHKPNVGDSLVLTAHGGVSSLTGGTNGAWGGGNPGGAQISTAPVHHAGGTGGSSKGSAGGGGGAGGNASSNGNNGGDSPRSSNLGTYRQGGSGGSGSGGAGNGGAGANSPGYPSAGAQPGGGGGGGYTQGTNKLGAAGGAGMIQITYSINNGVQVNGSATTFGTSATVGTPVVAHGGTSAGANTSAGAGAGSGSTNTVHFNGGKGAVSDNNGNYIVPPQSSQMTSLASVSFNAASGTATSSGSVPSGISLVFISAASGDATKLNVSDSAGNQYSLVTQQQVGGAGTAVLSAWAATITGAISSGTVLTVTAPSAVQYGVMWSGTVNALEVLYSNFSTSSGSSTLPSVTFGTADTTTAAIEVGALMNSGNQTFLSAFSPWNVVNTGGNTAGSQVMVARSMTDISVGTPDTLTSGSLATSSPWAAIAVPLVLRNQAYTAICLRTGSFPANTSTSFSPWSATGAYGMLVAVVFKPASSTLTIGGSPSITWVNRGSVNAGSSPLNVYTTSGTALTTSSTFTLTDSVSQTHEAAFFWLPFASGIDSTTPATSSGSSTAPSITSGTNSSPNDFAMTFFANNGSSITMSTPPANPWVNFGPTTSTTGSIEVYGELSKGTGTFSATGTYAASQTWAAVALGFVANVANANVGGSGGGSSAGPLGAGLDAADTLGAPGTTGGGKGGNGALVLDSSGVTASLPGGGGGGALSSNATPDGGGNGGAGMARITWQPPLTAFNNLIVHRPGDGAPQTLSPVSPIPPGDTPTNIEYPVVSNIPGTNATFNGTYSVLLANYLWDGNGQTSRQISVTVTQYEYVNGPGYSMQVTRTITPAVDCNNGMVIMGEVTLPVKDYDQANDETYFTFSVHDTNANDRFQDIVFLDTTGQTVFINIPPGFNGFGQYVNYFIDEATSDRDLGKILGTAVDRKHSISVMDSTFVSGGPLYVKSGDNILMTYSITGAPNIDVVYSPRWYTSRMQ